MPTSLMLLHHVLAATTTKKSSKGSGYTSILFLVAIFAVVYFLFLRPARNRQRAAATVRREVQVGDEITTTAGLIANVVAVNDDYLTLEIAPGVHSRYVPAAVLRVNNAEEEPADSESSDTERDVSTHEVIDVDSVDSHETERHDPNAEPVAADDVAPEQATSDDGRSDIRSDIDEDSTDPPARPTATDPNHFTTDTPDEPASA